MTLDADLYADELQWLARLARGLLQDADAADDVAQETVLAALRSKSAPRASGPGRRAWLGRVAKNLAFRRLRSGYRRTSREQARAQAVELPSTADLVERAEAAERLANYARSLPEPFCRTVLLRFFEARSVAEIAASEGMPVDTIRRRLRRGLELLRARLDAADAADGAARDSWRAALAPFALSPTLMPLSVGAKAWSTGSTSKAAASVAVPLVVGGMMSSKWWAGIAACVALVCGMAAITAVWGAADVEPDTAVDVQRVEAESAEVSSDSPLAASQAAVGREVVVPEQEPAMRTQIPAESATISGWVRDSAGVPVVGAEVFFPSGDEAAVPVDPATPVSPNAARSSSTLAAATRTDREGRFEFLVAGSLMQRIRDSGLELGTSADGFRRAFVRKPSLPEAPLLIVLDRGVGLVGRLVDPAGRPVPFVRLLATAARARVNHVSPSSSARRAERLRLSASSVSYDQCLTRSTANGEVRLAGLAPGALALRSLDPDWTVVGARSANGQPLDEVNPEGDSGPVFVAQPTFGVRVHVTDGRTGKRAGSVGAVFRVELALSDGRSEVFDQWVGRGTGGVVTFRWSADLLAKGTLDGVTIESAVFFGEVGMEVAQGEDSSIRSEWRAAAVYPRSQLRVADVQVVLGSSEEASAGEDSSEAVPMADVELMVRSTLGTPLEERLVVEWRDTSKPQPLDGESIAQRLGPGRYLASVAAGPRIALEVREWGSSGSLPAFQDVIACPFGRRTFVEITLETGGGVSLLRPAEWEGEWRVRASYRKDGEEEWFGSWGYSTDDAQLDLRSLVPAEWRFQVAQSEEELRRDPRVVIHRVQAGEKARLQVRGL